MVQPQPTSGRAKMPQCAFKNCANNHRNSNVSEGVSFFRFPTDPFRCAEWESIVALERGQVYRPSKNSTICSIHFNNVDIIGNTERRRLVKTALPKLQVAPSINLNDATSSIKIESGIKTVVVSINSSSPTASPLQDTPRKVEILKKQLIASRKIINTKRKQIHNLQKMIKRLQKNNLSLKNVINVLKNKKSVNDPVLYDLSKSSESFNGMLDTKKNVSSCAKYPSGAQKSVSDSIVMSMSGRTSKPEPIDIKPHDSFFNK